MRKRIILLLLIFVVSGCSKINFDDKDYVKYVDNVISNSNIYNKKAYSYKYYLPKGIKIIFDKDYNVIYDKNGTKMYLFVDIVSYYHKKNENLNNVDDCDYYKNISNDENKNGYISVKENENDLYIKIVYNYSKMEFYANKDNYEELITLSSIILNSINYNDKIIGKTMENSSISSGDVLYTIKDFDNNESTFSKYLNEYIEEEKDIELPEME